MKGYFENSSWGFQLIFGAFIVVVSFFIVAVFSTLLAIPIYGLEISKFNEYININNPLNLGFLKYFQGAQSIGLFVIPPFIIALLFGKSIKSYLHFDKKPMIQSLFMGGLMMIAVLPFINILSEWNMNMHLPDALSDLEQSMKTAEESAQKLMDLFFSSAGIKGLISNLIVMAVIPAVGEELLFRGFIQKQFIRATRNMHFGIILSAVFFSAFHMQFYGFLPRLVLGMLLGYMLIWSKSMWLPIIAHFTNNAMGVIIYFLSTTHPNLNEKAENIGTENGGIFLAISSIVIVITMMYAIYRQENISENPQINEEKLD